jgi:hypothetical protein
MLRPCAAFAGLAFLALAACGGPAEPTWAPDVEVARWAVPHEGPSGRVTVFTVINNENGTGLHTGLLIEGDQRVLFDPAGTFKHPHAPERNDVLYGISDRVLDVYIDYHARERFDVKIQEVDVPISVARQLSADAQAYGAVPKAQCSLAISRLLSKTPGFETVSPSYSPNRTYRNVAELPGVRTRIVTDDDANDNHGVLLMAAKEAEALRLAEAESQRQAARRASAE